MMETKTLNKKTKKKMQSYRKEQLIFYIAIAILPVIQFCVFYVYSKVQSILLAFQEYSYSKGSLGMQISFAGFDNFKKAFEIIGENWFMIKNSLIMYACDLIVGMGLSLIFSYYLTKKYTGSGLFKVFLFMPQIVSGVVFGILFRYIVNDIYVLLFEEQLGLLENEKTQFVTVLFYNIWIGFGTRVLITSSAMSNIDVSITEAAKLDGCTPLREFFSITFPLIFPTFSTLIVLGLVGIFTNQRSLYTLLQMNATTAANFGWYFYYMSLRADVIVNNSAYINYSQLSALGLIFSVIVYILVTVTRKAMDKYGPSVN